MTLFLGCNMNGSASSPTQVLSHSNGLRAPVSFEHSEVVHNENGFLIYVAPKNARQQEQIKVERRDQSPAGLNEERESAGIRLKFKQESYNEGSGGEEEILTIWKPAGANKGILVEHYVQGNSRVSIEAVWALAVASE